MGYFEQIANWCAGFIQGHPALSVIAIAALLILSVRMLWRILGLVIAGFGILARAMLRRKRRDFHGFGIVVTQPSGARGRQKMQDLIDLLQKHLSAFTFGAPYEVTASKALISKGPLGLRELAGQRMNSVAANLIIWGRAKRKAETELDVMSREIDPDTGFGRHETLVVPEELGLLTEAQSRAVAYLFARAFQPGLADAIGFRKEKIKPISDLLGAALREPGQLPAELVAEIEGDYCTMAMHAGDLDDFEYVVKLRRARLLSEGQLDRRTQIKARIDLGRALLALSEHKLDPTRVREAMDHLKQAIEILRQHPAIGLATATSDAVRQGERMLAAKRKFSVTGGSVL